MYNVKSANNNGSRGDRIRENAICRYNGDDRSAYRISVLGEYQNEIKQFQKTMDSYDKLVTPGCENYDHNFSYTTRVNDWCYANGLLFEKITQQQGGSARCRKWYYERTLYIMERVIKAVGIGSSINVAKEMCNYCIYLEIIQPRIQMDRESSKESEQGLTIQESSQSSNTIITRDEAAQETINTESTSLINIVSSEPISTFDECVGRWMPLQIVTVSTSKKQGDFITSYYLPETLFYQMCKSINLLPFEAYIYSELEVEMKFITNANKFQCGKLLVSVKFDSYQADLIQNTINANLCRPHVIIDLSSNNEVTVKVPFRYHRALMRNVKNDLSSVGIRPSKYASLYVQVLSPLRTGPGGATEMNIRPFARFVKAKFAGMSYRVKVQMDSVGLLMNALPSQELKGVLSGAEKLLKGLGNTSNRDKPTTLKSIITIPRPKLNFCTGKGLMDVVPLKSNPYAMTSYQHIKPYSDDPKTMLDIAHIWGLRSAFTWKAGDKPSDNFLGSMLIDPTCRAYGEEYDGVPTPLETVCSMYNFWSGPIEFRLDFVSNAFHTGAIMVSIEFGRPSEGQGRESKCDAASTYTKTFHLGDQKTFSFTVPYIYDTVWRRTSGLPYDPMFAGKKGDDEVRKRSLVVYPESKTFVNIQIINELRPVSSAPQEIDVLVFWRGGPNFMVHSLKQPSFKNAGKGPAMDNFPLDGYAPVVPTVESGGRTTRSVQNPTAGKWLDKSVANEWNEYAVEHVRIQMDTGEKENSDPTDDFGVGRFNLGVQTNDSQVSIKDIMRRPVLMVYRKEVDALDKNNNTGFFIPVMPPSAMMTFRAEEPNTIYSHMVGVSPQANIANLFRFWRGCSRFTVIVEETGGPKFVNGQVGVTYNSPVYVTYVPHTGTRIFGNKMLYGTQESASLRPIFGSGLATEMIIPSVNPVVTVETPYDTENNWTLMFDEDGKRNFSWRDKGDTNCGHIVISSAFRCVVTVWWSGGDDFELANFYGMRTGYTKDTEYSYPDRHARVQMEDFRQEDSSYWRRAVRVGQNMWPLALSSVPIIGGPLTTGIAATKAMGTMDKVNELSKTWTSVGGRVNQTLDSVNDKIEDVTGVLNMLHSQITGLMENFTQRMPSIEKIRYIVQDVIIDVFMAWYTKTWMAVGAGVVRLISKVFNITNIYSYIEPLTTAITNLMTNTVYVQADNTTGTVIGVLAGLIGTALGVCLDTNKYLTKFQLLVTRFTTASGIAYFNQILLFVRNTFECIQTMVMDALGMVDPNVKSLQYLSNNSEYIQDFVRSAQDCLNESNAHLLLNARFRIKFWSTVLKAYQIQRAVTAVRVDNPGLPSLLKLTGEVIKKGTEKFVDLSCSPVRYEPFVICIVGGSNIGKSYCSKQILNELLDNLNLRTPGETIYTRMPGSKYWNGYRGHQCVVYDDWLNLSDPELVSQQLNELYMLKSTCEFIPDMADLADKKVKANPLIVLQLCNDAFPSSIANVASHKEAIYRRRDIVLEARLKTEYAGIKPRDLVEKNIPVGSQLEFTMWKDSSNLESKMTTYKTYEETVNYLKLKHARYHSQENINVKKRIQALQIGFAETAEEVIADPFELFYSTQLRYVSDAQTGWLPSEQLEYAVKEIVDGVRRVNVEPVITVPEEPGNIFQANVGGFITNVIKALVTNTTTVVAMMSWTWEKLEEYLNKYLDTGDVLRGRCPVCLEDDVVLKWACVSAEEQHAICSDCYINMRNAAESDEVHLRCPICRNSNMQLLLHGSTGAIYIAIKWVLDRGHQYITPVLKFLKRAAYKTPSKIFNILRLLSTLIKPFTYANSGSILGEIINSTINAHVSQLNLDQEVQPGMHTLALAQPLYEINQTLLAQTQSDWPEIEPVAEEIEEEEPDNLRNVAINEELLDDYVGCILHQGIASCKHAYLLDNVQSAVYERRAGEHNIWMWRVPYNDGARDLFIYIEDGPCGVECPFLDKVNVKSFFLNWILFNRVPMVDKYMQVHNNVLNRERVLASIPRLLRPNWMGAPIIQLHSNWWEYLAEIYDKYKMLISICSLTAMAIGGVYAITRTVNYFNVPQSDLNYNSGEIRQLRRLNRVPRLTRQEITPQAEELTSVVSEYIARNYVLIKIWRDGKLYSQLAAVGIQNNTCIMPKHYMQVLSKETKITIEPAVYQNGEANHLRKDYVYCFTDFIELADVDLVFFNLPKSFPLFKSIKKFIQKESDLADYLPSYGEIILVPTRKRQMIGVRSVDIQGISQAVKVEDKDGSIMVAHDVLKYNHSEAGACSSLLITTGQRPIRSMHIAGSDSNDGYGLLLTQELLDTILVDVVKLQYEEVELAGIDEREDTPIFDLDCQVHYLGVLEKGKVPFCPKKTKIERSLISGEPKTAPAYLSGQDENYLKLGYARSPLWYGCEKHGKLTKDFDRVVLGKCSQALADMLLSSVRPLRVNPKRLTVNQAISGFNGLEFYDPMKLDTSAGYPWQLGENTLKSSIIKVERNEHGEIINIECHPDLIKEIDRKENLRKQGIIPCTIFVDTLKDERKLLEKRNKKGGTRVFCASPTDFTIAMRQNMLDYSAAFMKARFNAGHAVGINAKGKEWTELYRRLVAISPHNIIMLDYSNFGPAFNTGVAHEVCKIMIKWIVTNVGEVNEVELWALLYECIHSVHAMSATVYRQFAGSPSGAAITTLINTHVNEMYVLLAWYSLCKEKALLISPDIFGVFKKHVCMVAYGDDLIMSVSDTFKDLFNTLTIQNFFSQYGITATSAEKDNVNVAPFVNIMQAMFLKRKFRNHDTRDGYMLSPLDITSVEEIPLWIWKSADKKAATKINVESALLEAHGHGKDYYDKFKEKLNSALSCKNIESTTLNWEDLDDLWFQDKMPGTIDCLI